MAHVLIPTEDAAKWLDRSITLCRKAAFRRVRLRGDTAFMQTDKLDSSQKQ